MRAINRQLQKVGRFCESRFILLTCGPDLQGVVDSGGGQEFAVRGPGDRHDIACMTAIDKDVVSGDSVQYVHQFVVATGSNKPAIGRPGYAVESGGSIAVDDEFLTGRSIPYLQAFVVAHRGNALAVG